MMIIDKAAYSVKETAKILGVSEITIYRKVATTNEIPFKKIGSRILIPADFINNFRSVN